MALSVSIQQAVVNALGAWLRAQLPDVEMLDNWPEPGFALPAKAISILMRGEPNQELTQPDITGQADIHDAISASVDLADPADLAEAEALLNACKVSYETARLDVAAHAAADVTNVITAADATDLTTAEQLADDLSATLVAHFADAAAHANADAKSSIAAGSVVGAGLSAVIARAIAIRDALNRHYAARIFTWRLADATQSLQLDVWAKYQPVLDDILARLVPVLNASLSESAPGLSAYAARSEDPRNGVLLELGDGWEGTCDFDFRPALLGDENSQQRSEYRATYFGDVAFVVSVRAQNARMARITLALTTTPGDVPAAPGSPQQTAELAWDPVAALEAFTDT